MDWFCENDHPINNPVDVCYLANTIFPQIAGLILMISVNALMVHYFLNGMNESGSVAGSAISMASNFSVSVSFQSLECMSEFTGILVTKRDYINFINIFYSNESYFFIRLLTDIFCFKIRSVSFG